MFQSFYGFSSSLSDYPSFLRPKGIPEVDYFTLLGIRLIWTFMGFARKFKIFAFIFLKLRVMHLVNWIFLKLQVRSTQGIIKVNLFTKKCLLFQKRIARIMENSDVDWEKKRAIKVPEYDWKNGSPDEFYQTFVKRPHPVVLRSPIQ